MRPEISTRNMEGLAGALNYLLKLLAMPANQQALAAQGHTPTDTQAFAAAQQLSATLELTDENIKAGNALWEYIMDVLGIGSLLYKATNLRKAKTYTTATLLKRIRKV